MHRFVINTVLCIGSFSVRAYRRVCAGGRWLVRQSLL